MATRTTVNISLTPDLQEYINHQMTSGRYVSVSEVVRDALRLAERHDQQLYVEKLRAEIKVGVAQLERGEGRDGETVFAELHQQLAKKTRRASRAKPVRKSA